jgi:transposase
MTKHSSNSQTASYCREELNSTSAAGSTAERRHQVIKLAIDAHAKFYMVARQIDNAPSQPPQKFTREELLKFIAKQVGLADKVYTCYEAGCFGFGLHRDILALGAINLVIAPQNWDERNKKVKTDRVDATAIVGRLDRYVAGNPKALAVVHVPTEDEELRRSRVRQRQQFMSDRNRWANQGKSLLLLYGLHVSWSWWQKGKYEGIERLVRKQCGNRAERILQMLADYREMALKVSEKLEALTKELYKPRPERPAGKRIKGMGELSAARIEAEVGDWTRFTNRRQVASYTGLCPGVTGSAGHFTSLSISKHGNRRLRSVLVELAWLMVRYQPDYPPVQRWREVMAGKNRPARKKAIVAVARRLAVDLWRLETGRATAQELGLQVMKMEVKKAA